MQRFACPSCGNPSGDIRAGQELEIESISLDDITAETTDDNTPHP
jgi:Zn finger protein HypA/HybF involved in hydrogenase expression